MGDNIETLLQQVRVTPPRFSKFSKDPQQIDPQARLISIVSILNCIEFLQCSTIVDIGTGYGYGAVLLNSMGYNVIGIEINRGKLEDGMDYWKRLGLEFHKTDDASSALATKGKLYFMNRDAGDMEDFPISSVNMATAFYISGHMAKQDGAFRDVSRILKSNGTLTVTTEGPRFLPSSYREGAVMLLSRLLSPKNMKLSSSFALHHMRVHDKFVLTYEQASMVPQTLPSLARFKYEPALQ